MKSHGLWADILNQKQYWEKTSLSSCVHKVVSRYMRLNQLNTIKDYKRLALIVIERTGWTHRSTLKSLSDFYNLALHDNQKLRFGFDGMEYIVFPPLMKFRIEAYRSKLDQFNNLKSCCICGVKENKSSLISKYFYFDSLPTQTKKFLRKTETRRDIDGLFCKNCLSRVTKLHKLCNKLNQFKTEIEKCKSKAQQI